MRTTERSIQLRAMPSPSAAQTLPATEKKDKEILELSV
jgi:hypothetical protein